LIVWNLSQPIFKCINHQPFLSKQFPVCPFFSDLDSLFLMVRLFFGVEGPDVSEPLILIKTEDVYDGIACSMALRRLNVELT